MMGRGGGGLFMLRNKSVQDELKMTQPQIEKLDAKQQELMQSMRELFQGGQGQNDPQARRSMMMKMQEMQQKAVADILDTAQQKRFKQIELQMEGPAAITRKDVADELKLTDAQRAQVRSIQQDVQSQMQSMRQGVDFRNMSDEDRQQMFQKMQAIQKAAGDRYAAVLTSTQKAHWKQMLGAPFKFVPETPQAT